jgi:hypothetical protein
MTMETVFISIVKDGTAIEGMAETIDTLPSAYTKVEVYAVRASTSAIEDALAMMSKRNPEGALKLLKRCAHSFTYIGTA